jgi:hypothetical protein
MPDTDPWRVVSDVQIADSVTDLRPGASAGRLVACGSHGGIFAGRLAAHLQVRGIVFNDAGVGRDQAGISGLAVLAAYGIPAAAVSHGDAEIGRGRSTLAASVLHVNEPAALIGCRPGQPTGDVLAQMSSAPGTTANAPRPDQARRQVADGGVRLCVLDSASQVRADDAGAVLVTGSHGGLPGGSPARALKVDARAAIFNDAHGGRNGAGWSRLLPLGRRNIPAATVSALSARIGDGTSSLDDGVLSHVNDAAARVGGCPGMSARQFVDLVAAASEGRDR